MAIEIVSVPLKILIFHNYVAVYQRVRNHDGIDNPGKPIFMDENDFNTYHA